MPAPNTPTASDRRIVRLFAGLALLLPVQYVLVRRAGEFYPSIFMPSFAGNPTDAAGHFSYRAGWLDVTFRDSGRARVEWSRLFIAPPTHVVGIAALNLGDGRPPPPAGSPAPGAWQRHVIPAYAPARLRRAYDLPIDTRTVAWLDTRLQELFPGRKPAFAEVNWRDLHFVYRDGGAQPAAGPAAEFIRRIDF